MSSRFGRFFNRFTARAEEEQKKKQALQSQQPFSLRVNMNQLRREAIEREEKEKMARALNFERRTKERINALGFDPYDPSHREYLANLEQRNPELRSHLINQVERYEKEQKEKQVKMMSASNRNRNRNHSSRHHSRRHHSHRHHSNRNRHHSNRNRHHYSRRHRHHRVNETADPALPEVNLGLSMDPIDVPNNRNSSQQQANSNVAQNSRNNIQVQNNPNVA